MKRAMRRASRPRAFSYTQALDLRKEVTAIMTKYGVLFDEEHKNNSVMRDEIIVAAIEMSKK
jgi:hypothetical protein